MRYILIIKMPSIVIHDFVEISVAQKLGIVYLCLTHYVETVI